MLAPLRGFRSRFTGSDTELVGGHEVGPFMDLLPETLTTVPNVCENKAAMGIAKTIG